MGGEIATPFDEWFCGSAEPRPGAAGPSAGLGLLGAHQPKWSAIAGAASNIDSGSWHLHVKDVPRISLDAAEQLTGGEASLTQLRYVRGWLQDDSRYFSILKKGARGIPTTSMQEDWIDKLREHSVIVDIDRKDVRGWVHMFAVPEPAKKRFRPIKFTRDVNEALGRDTVLPMRFPAKQEICGLVNLGECFIALDFAAYFDQFVYTPEVGSRFCFRRGNKYFRLNTLAMGQRHAVEVAACTTARLLDFDPKTTTKSIIDNVIFVGSREDVIRDATTFVERVRAVGAKLNEDTSDIAALVQTTGDWGGIHLDFVNKTSCLAEKTVAKTAQSWQHRGEWTWRTFAGHIGLLFWAWQLIETPMSEFFELLRFISHVGQLLTERSDLWDAPAMIRRSAWPDLERWTALVLANAPRVVPTQQAPEWLVATDASEYGWGYFAVHNTSGLVRTHGAPWTPVFRRLYGNRLGTSTFTEPQGVINAMCHLLDPAAPQRVRVLTDNTATQAVFQRGFSSRSFHMNECVSRLHKVFGNTFVFDFAYLPGKVNPADGFSRGLIAEGESVRGSMSAAELQRIAGSTVPPGNSDWPNVAPT